MTDEEKEHIKTLALSGLLSGSILAGGTRALTDAKSVWDIAKSAGKGGAIGAALSAGSGYVGQRLLGAPSASEEDPYTKRGIVGGAVGGGLAGGIAGAALGSGSLPQVAETVAGAGAASKVRSFLQPKNENFIFDALRKTALKGGTKGALLGAGAGALGLGAIAAYQGMDEGMQADVLSHMRKKKMRGGSES